jgi:hypothetical protein
VAPTGTRNLQVKGCGAFETGTTTTMELPRRDCSMRHTVLALAYDAEQAYLPRYAIVASEIDRTQTALDLSARTWVPLTQVLVTAEPEPAPNQNWSVSSGYVADGKRYPYLPARMLREPLAVPVALDASLPGFVSYALARRTEERTWQRDQAEIAISDARPVIARVTDSPLPEFGVRVVNRTIELSGIASDAPGLTITASNVGVGVVIDWTLQLRHGDTKVVLPSDGVTGGEVVSATATLTRETPTARWTRERRTEAVPATGL